MKRFALKRLTALVLALIMTLSLLPMNVWAEEMQENAEEQAVAATEETEYTSEEVGVSAPDANALSTYEVRWGYANTATTVPYEWAGYGSLNDAIWYAEEETSKQYYIQLCRDITREEAVMVSNNARITLDLNGHDITRTHKYSGYYERGHVIAVTSGAKLTICGSGEISGGRADKGGGLYVHYASVTMEGGTITDNYARYEGGGVYLGYNSTFTMKNGTISNNSALSGGGVCIVQGSKFIFNGKDGDISKNTAGTCGGGVYVISGTFEVDLGYQCFFDVIENTARDGGGVYIDSDSRVNMDMNSNSDIAGNTAYNFGGGMYINSENNISIRYGKIRQNTATCGGGVYIASVTDDIWFQFDVSRIEENTASEKGGGIYLAENVVLSKNAIMTDIWENTAEYGGGVYASEGSSANLPISVWENAATKSGGGIYVAENSNVTQSNGDVWNNTAQLGGGVYVDGEYEFAADDTDFYKISENTAEVAGGGVYVSETGAFTLKGKITGNSAANIGGGVCSYGRVILSDGGAIAQNTACCGGGVAVMDDAFIMEGGAISGNSATGELSTYGHSGGRGGGVLLDSDAAFLMSGGTICGNNTENVGGGVCLLFSENEDGEIETGALQVYGTPIISDNVRKGEVNSETNLYEIGSEGTENNIYLPQEAVITIIAPLQETASVGVTAYTTPISGVPIPVAQGGKDPYYTLTEEDGEKFFSDSGYPITLDRRENSLQVEDFEDPTVKLTATTGQLNLFQEDVLTIPVECNYEFVGATLEDSAANDMFDLSLGENGTVQITPKDKPEDMTWVEWGEKVGTYTSAMKIEYFRGRYITTSEQLTITLTATAPAAAAEEIIFNSFLAGDTKNLVLTSDDGVMESITLDESKENPAWVVLNEDQTVTLINENLDSNTGSGELNLKVWLEGWRAPAQVAVPISVIYGAPELTLDKSSVNLVGRAAYQEPVALELRSADGDFDIAKIIGLTVDNEAYTVEYLGEGKFLLDTVEDITAGTINIMATVEGGASAITIPLTVKVVTLSVKANTSKVTLNPIMGYEEGARDEKSVTFSGDVPEMWFSDIVYEVIPPANGSEDMLTLVNNGDGSVTIYANRGVVDGSYKVNVTVGAAKPVTITVTVKATLPKLKLNKSTVTLVGRAAYQEPVELALVSSDKNFDISKVTAISADNDAYTIEYLGAGKFLLDTVEDVTAGKVNLFATIAGGSHTVKVPLTVKISAPTVKASTTKVTLNTAMGAGMMRDEKTVTFSGNIPEAWYSDIVWEIIPPKNGTAEMLTVENSGDGALTIYGNEGIVDGSYKVNVTVGAAKPVAITVTAKATTLKLKPSVSSVTLNMVMGVGGDEKFITIASGNEVYDIVGFGSSTEVSIAGPANGGELYWQMVNNQLYLTTSENTTEGSYKVTVTNTMPGGQEISCNLTVKVIKKAPLMELDKMKVTLNLAMGPGADAPEIAVSIDDPDYEFTLQYEDVWIYGPANSTGLWHRVEENNKLVIGTLPGTTPGDYEVWILHRLPLENSATAAVLKVKVESKLPTLKPDVKSISLAKRGGVATVNVAGIDGFAVGELVAEPTVDGITVEMIDRDSFVVTADETLDKKGGKINVYYKLSDAVQTKPVAITVKPVDKISATATVKGNIDTARPDTTFANITFKSSGWYPGEYVEGRDPILSWAVVAMEGKKEIGFVASGTYEGYPYSHGWFVNISEDPYGVCLAIDTRSEEWQNGEIKSNYSYVVHFALTLPGDDFPTNFCKSVKLTVKQGSTKFAADTKAVTVTKQQDAISEVFTINGTDKDKVNVADIAMVAVAANKKPSAFAVVESGDGYAIKVIDPTIAKNGTVKVNIWLEGNYADGCEEIWDTKNLEYRKPNATVSLKVTVK